MGSGCRLLCTNWWRRPGSLEAVEAAARQRRLDGAVDQFPRDQSAHGWGERDRRVHHRQVQARHPGDRADDGLAVGRHGAYADPGAERLDARGAAEGGPDGGQSLFRRIRSGDYPVRGDLPKIKVLGVDYRADQTGRGAELEERRRMPRRPSPGAAAGWAQASPRWPRR